MAQVGTHYNEDYFSWQKPMGGFGGGYLLKFLNCRGKLGIEVNSSAREQARLMGITTYESAKSIENGWADVVISTNVLEHTLNALQELKELYEKLRSRGRVIFIVPCESIKNKYRPNDINRHLYSWSPMGIGNLFTEAGFEVEEVMPYIHKWPPFYKMIVRIGGRKLFDFLSRIYGHFERSWFQVKVVARKS